MREKKETTFLHLRKQRLRLSDPIESAVRGAVFERRSLSGGMSCADGGQAGPAPLVNHPAHGREKGSALLSPPRPPHSSRKASADISRSAGGLVESAETCAKTVCDGFLRPCGRDQTAQIWVGGCTSSFPVLNEEKPDITDTTRTIFDRIVRAACGFESLHVRDRAVDFSTARRRVLLYARFDRCSRSEPKNVPKGLFRMFQLTPPVRAMPF